MTNLWEYGIAIGTLGILVPTLVWVVKYSLSATAKATAEVHQQNYAELKRLSQAVLDKLQDRDRACSYDHDKLVEEIHKLTTSLAELAGMLTFILNHYIKVNGGPKE